jgi:vacuolar protein sorting-associated protein 26
MSLAIPAERRYSKLTSLELFYDRGNHYEFVSLAQELTSGGEMRQAQTFDFAFKNVGKQYESYSGINVKLRWVKCCCGA